MVTSDMFHNANYEFQGEVKDVRLNTLKKKLIQHSTKNTKDLPQIQIEIKNGMGGIKKINLSKHISKGDNKLGMRSMSTDQSANKAAVRRVIQP